MIFLVYVFISGLYRLSSGLKYVHIDTAVEISNEKFDQNFIFNVKSLMPMMLLLKKLIQPTSLSIPYNASYTNYYIIVIESSCVASVEEGFFSRIGNLQRIELVNISCLTSLTFKSFGKIIPTLTYFILKNILSLSFIEQNILQTFPNLLEIKVTDTSLKNIPSSILINSKKYLKADFSRNKINFILLKNTSDYVISLNAFDNPLTCSCFSKNFFIYVKRQRMCQLYRCYNPPYLRGYTFCVIGDICNGTMTTSTKSSINTTSCSRSSLKSLTQETTNTTLNIDISTKKDSYKSHKMITKSPILFTQVSFSGNDYEYASVRWIVVYVIISVTLIVLFVGIGLVIFGFVSIKNHSRCSNSTPTKMFFSEETIYDELFV